MKDTFIYIIFVFLLLIFMFALSNIHRILPTMDGDEYFEEHRTLKELPDDEWVILHNAGCPMHDVPWFTRKHSKYHIMIERKMEFCDQCFDENEVELLIQIHNHNLRGYANRLCGKYSQHTIDSIMSTYYIRPRLKDLFEDN